MITQLKLQKEYPEILPVSLFQNPSMIKFEKFRNTNTFKEIKQNYYLNYSNNIKHEAASPLLKMRSFIQSNFKNDTKTIDSQVSLAKTEIPTTQYQTKQLKDQKSYSHHSIHTEYQSNINQQQQQQQYQQQQVNLQANYFQKKQTHQQKSLYDNYEQVLERNKQIISKSNQRDKSTSNISSNKVNTTIVSTSQFDTGNNNSSNSNNNYYRQNVQQQQQYQQQTPSNTYSQSEKKEIPKIPSQQYLQTQQSYKEFVQKNDYFTSSKPENMESSEHYNQNLINSQSNQQQNSSYYLQKPKKTQQVRATEYSQPPLNMKQQNPVVQLKDLGFNVHKSEIETSSSSFNLRPKLYSSILEGSSTSTSKNNSNNNNNINQTVGNSVREFKADFKIIRNSKNETGNSQVTKGSFLRKEATTREQSEEMSSCREDTSGKDLRELSTPKIQLQKSDHLAKLPYPGISIQHKEYSQQQQTINQQQQKEKQIQQIVHKNKDFKPIYNFKREGTKQNTRQQSNTFVDQTQIQQQSGQKTPLLKKKPNLTSQQQHVTINLQQYINNGNQNNNNNGKISRSVSNQGQSFLQKQDSQNLHVSVQNYENKHNFNTNSNNNGLNGQNGNNQGDFMYQANNYGGIFKSQQAYGANSSSPQNGGGNKRFLYDQGQNQLYSQTQYQVGSGQGDMGKYMH